MNYKVRITSGGISLWISDSPEKPFTEDESEAATFNDSFAQFNKFVLSEVEFLPFRGDKTYGQMGLEKIEFIFV